MHKFYVDNQISCEVRRSHVVHREDCPQLPGESRRLYIGHFTCKDEALKRSKVIYPTSDACEVCCR